MAIGQMSVMGKEGDTKIIWDRKKVEEVEHAKKSFDEFRKKGYAAYKVTGEKGEKGEVLYSFNPDAERIIFAPPMVGG